MMAMLCEQQYGWAQETAAAALCGHNHPSSPTLVLVEERWANYD